jgi:hypothetical protein
MPQQESAKLVSSDLPNLQLTQSTGQSRRAVNPNSTKGPLWLMEAVLLMLSA